MGARSLLLLAAVACNAKHPAPKQAAPPARDPWAPSTGSAYDPIAFGGSDTPAWAHDPPDVLRDKINGVNAHVIVLKSSSTFAEYRDVLASAERTPGVTAAEPFIFTEDQMANGSAAPVSVAVKGVDPARVGRVLTIAQHMVDGSLDVLAGSGTPAPIVLGDTLAHTLGVRIGDQVTVTTPVNDEDWQKLPPRTGPFRVAGTFHMDFDQYDDRLALAPLAAIQALVGRGDQVMGIEMTVKDVAHADAVAKALETTLGGPPYQAMDWYELNKNLFNALYGDKRP